MLAVGAHPDDIEMGCGGTLLKLISQGAEVHLLVMTEGGASDVDPRVRHKEVLASFDKLGAKALNPAFLKDTQIDLKEAIQCIEKVVDVSNPDVIFTHWHRDTHQDHRTVADAVLSACRRRGGILFCETLSTHSFNPSVFVDITEWMPDKMELIDCYKSQVSRLNLADWAKRTAYYRGISAKFGVAEGFMPYRMEIFK